MRQQLMDHYNTRKADRQAGRSAGSWTHAGGGFDAQAYIANMSNKLKEGE